MGLWTPAQRATVIWLDASDVNTLYDATSGGFLVASDGTVARWEDKSGNARHVTQSNSSLRPLRKVTQQNGLDVLRFDGGDRLINSSLSQSSPASFYVVAKVATSESDGAVFFDSLNSSQFVLYRGFSADNPGSYVFAAGSSLPISGTANNSFNVHSGVAATGSTSVHAFNGTPTLGTTGANTLSGISIGNLRGNPSPLVGSYGLNGDLCEIIIIAGADSQTDRQVCEGYLAWKWGLQANLPSDHSYKNAAPRTGIARPKINGSLLNRGLINGSLIQ